MATLPSLDSQAKVVSDAAQNFVENYYNSLNKRLPLAQYYADSSTHLTSASVKPDISINGRVLDSPAEYETLLDKQGAPVYYDVLSFDAHVVNPNYSLGCPKALSLSADEATPGQAKVAKSIKDGDRVSFAIQVNGSVRYGKPGDGPAATGVKTTAADTFNPLTTATTTTPSNPTTTPAPTPAPTSDTTPAAAATGEQGGNSTAEAQPVESAFNEAWYLVPHWEALGRNAARGLRGWLVVSQNFRTF
ncbi:hypothetical protein F4861DRAFT_293608 [Xylaria intraflava]|nr:hypothetical protein F4861DRAFT_293608 [Xylaria intraflava]